MISFIIAYKQDTDERAVNLEYCKKYYQRLVPSCEVIIKESSDNNFNKCELYNKGASEATHDVLCFLDSDVFVSKYSIQKSIELADADNVIISYNGIAIYLSYKSKRALTGDLTYQDMLNILPVNYVPSRLDKNEMFEVGNLKAVGGCLVMSKDCFRDVNGFNPNFINWGYEDNEIVTRCHKLKKNVIFTNTKEPYLFHLPHHDVDEDKSIHDFYNNNQLEYKKVCEMTHNDLQEYIKTWQTSAVKKLTIKVDIIDNNFVSYDRSCCRFQRPANLEWDPTLKSGSRSIFLTDESILTIDTLNTKQQKVAWLLEPRAVIPHIYSYIENNYDKFDFILTYDNMLVDMSPKFLFYPFGCCWIPPYITGVGPEKTEHMSIIASGKNQTMGHQLRHRVIRELDMISNPSIDVLGNGYKPFKNKKDGLEKYKFSIVIENSIQDTYFTEKIIDCFATKTVPIYYGTSKITDFFDKDGIIPFTTVDELEEIIDKLTDQYYGKMIKGIENNFNKYKNFIVPENFIEDNYSDLLL